MANLDRHPLLGTTDSRNFRIYRTKFPAIFRFNGQLFQEHFNIDTNVQEWIEITPELAEPWLKAKDVAMDSGALRPPEPQDFNERYL